MLGTNYNDCKAHIERAHAEARLVDPAGGVIFIRVSSHQSQIARINGKLVIGYKCLVAGASF